MIRQRLPVVQLAPCVWPMRTTTGLMNGSRCPLACSVLVGAGFLAGATFAATAVAGFAIGFAGVFAAVFTAGLAAGFAAAVLAVVFAVVVFAVALCEAGAAGFCAGYAWFPEAMAGYACPAAIPAARI